MSDNIIDFPGMDVASDNLIFEPASELILERAKQLCQGGVVVIGIQEEGDSAVTGSFGLSTNLSLEEVLFLLKRAENAITRVD